MDRSRSAAALTSVQNQWLVLPPAAMSAFAGVAAVFACATAGRWASPAVWLTALAACLVAAVSVLTAEPAASVAVVFGFTPRPSALSGGAPVFASFRSVAGLSCHLAFSLFS